MQNQVQRGMNGLKGFQIWKNWTCFKRIQILMSLTGEKMECCNCVGSIAKVIQTCNNTNTNDKNDANINMMITVQPESEMATKTTGDNTILPIINNLRQDIWIETRNKWANTASSKIKVICDSGSMLKFFFGSMSVYFQNGIHITSLRSWLCKVTAVMKYNRTMFKKSVAIRKWSVLYYRCIFVLFLVQHMSINIQVFTIHLALSITKSHVSWYGNSGKLCTRACIVKSFCVNIALFSSIPFGSAYSVSNQFDPDASSAFWIRINKYHQHWHPGAWRICNKILHKQNKKKNSSDNRTRTLTGKRNT